MADEAKQAMIYNDICNEMCGRKTTDVHFDIHWAARLRVVQIAVGGRIVVEEMADQELREVPIEHAVSLLLQWLQMQPRPEIFLTHSQAKIAIKTWQSSAPAIDASLIANVSWRSTPGYTWRRLPWDRIEGATPTWDKMLAKVSNAAALRQWFGALLSANAKQHQYVWIHGMGNDGKGSINRFLSLVFGRSYRSKQPPAMGDKFWTYGLIGARLVVLPDCNSQTFTTGGLFKSLSGGDPIDVEAKGRMSFTARLNCMFLFLSNEKPNISCEDADMRRIIYCDFTERATKADMDSRFEEKLWAEGGPFLTRCVLEYEAACPNHGPIESDKDSILEWISVNEERFQHHYDSHYKQPIDEYRTSKGLGALTDEQFELVTVKPANMLRLTGDEFKERKEQAAFRDWLYKKYGVKKCSVRRGDVVVYAYVGIMRQPTNEAAKRLDKAITNHLRLASTPSTVDVLTE